VGLTMTEDSSANQQLADTFRAAVVVVTKEPDLARLARLVERLVAPSALSWQSVWVVDNNSANQREVERCCDEQGVALLALSDNRGIAGAINHVLATQRLAGVEWLVTFDQDSLPPADYALAMQATIDNVTAPLGDPDPSNPDPLNPDPSNPDPSDPAPSDSSPEIAAIGPLIIDQPGSRMIGFSRQHWWGVDRQMPTSGVVEADYIIFSGMVCRVAVLKELGGFDERLFLDNVDIDFCFRARRAGYRILGTADSQLDHRIGDRVLSLGFTKSIFKLHSPERVGWMTNSRWLLYRYSHVPLAWKCWDLLRFLAKTGIIVVRGGRPLAYAKAVLRGMTQGLLGRSVVQVNDALEP